MRKLFIILVIVTGFSGEKSILAATDSIFCMSGDMLAYLNNLEYYNGYRKGEPFWGSYIKIRASFRPYEYLSFSGGIHMRKDFGDDRFLTDIRPLFRAHYHKNSFHFVIGELFCKGRHGLLDALLLEQYSFRPGVEEGIQLRYDGAMVKQDLWAIYPALNTPGHREHLCVGNATVLTVHSFAFYCMLYFSHYGGQLFSPEGDPVRWNSTAAGGISYVKQFPYLFEECGVEQFLIGSYTDTDVRPLTTHTGWGSVSRIWMQISGFKYAVLFYKGSNYITWEGNPLYQSNEPYYYLEISRTVQFTPRVFFDFGLRFDFMNITPDDYFKNGDNQLWLVLGFSFDKKIR